MAAGPDPNRYVPPDPETSASAHRDGEGLGDLPSTRFGLPSWAIAAIALLICLFVLWLALRGAGGPG
jgi:hypothetical protein